jgi:hypothetical protein
MDLASRVSMAVLATVAAPALAASLAACTQQQTIPAPEPMIDAYAEALNNKDAEAIYGMMSDESRRAISKEELRRVLDEQNKELGEHAKGVSSEERVLHARAEVRYDDGEVVSLDLDNGRFKVTAADALPAAAKTPAQALTQLRRVLARRSYAGLLRVLSPRTRAAIERDLRSLVEGLTDPEALSVDVVGDAATVDVPGGHQVKLRREDGVWHVDDFN